MRFGRKSGLEIFKNSNVNRGNQPTFLRFLERTHRRRLAWRVIEHAGVGLLAGCAVSLALVLALWWRGDDAMSGAVVTLMISFVAGVVASARNIPSILDTAMLAESFLKSPQLLSSALLTNNGGGFSNAVIAM